MGRLLLACGVLLSLLLALLGGFYLGSAPPAKITREPEPEPAPVEGAADASGALGLRVAELETIVLRADRENATLKRRVATAEAGQARAEQAMARLEAELADSRARQERTLDDLARLRRELAQRAAPPPAPTSPPPVLVRLLSLDPATQVVAIDRGTDDGLRIGDRHRLEDTAGASAVIEWTEIRPTFAVGRRIPTDQPGATVLELVSGRQYALIPPP